MGQHEGRPAAAAPSLNKHLVFFLLLLLFVYFCFFQTPAPPIRSSAAVRICSRTHTHGSLYQRVCVCVCVWGGGESPLSLVLEQQHPLTFSPTLDAASTGTTVRVILLPPPPTAPRTCARIVCLARGRFSREKTGGRTSASLSRHIPPRCQSRGTRFTRTRTRS